MLRKRSKRRSLTLAQKVEAAHMVFLGKEAQAVVAKHFRVSKFVMS